MVSTIRIYVPAAEAKPGPPLAPILGQHQVNLIEFCKEFNKLSALTWSNSIPLMVKVLKRENNKFSLLIRLPSSKFFLDQILTNNALRINDLYDIIKLRSVVTGLDLKSTSKMFLGFLNSKVSISIDI